MRILSKFKTIIQAEIKGLQAELNKYRGLDAFIIVASPW